MVREWVQLALGAWIMVSPWLLGFSSITAMTWGNVFAGLAIILVNLWAIFLPKEPGQDQ